MSHLYHVLLKGDCGGLGTIWRWRYTSKEGEENNWQLTYHSSPIHFQLNKVDLELLSMQSCRNDFKYKNNWITSRMMCTWVKVSTPPTNRIEFLNFDLRVQLLRHCFQSRYKTQRLSLLKPERSSMRWVYLSGDPSLILNHFWWKQLVETSCVWSE